MYKSWTNLGYGLSFGLDWMWPKDCPILVLTQVGFNQLKDSPEGKNKKKKVTAHTCN